MSNHSTKFHIRLIISFFRVILFTDKQTHTGESITSLAEVNTGAIQKWYLFSVSVKRRRCCLQVAEARAATAVDGRSQHWRPRSCTSPETGPESTSSSSSSCVATTRRPARSAQSRRPSGSRYPSRSTTSSTRSVQSVTFWAAVTRFYYYLILIFILSFLFFFLVFLWSFSLFCVVYVCTMI